MGYDAGDFAHYLGWQKGKFAQGVRVGADEGMILREKADTIFYYFNDLYSK